MQDDSKQTSPHVVVVGGGLAGIAAAVALSRNGYRITLLESRPRLGGRATSIQDQQTGEWIDNCQHVSMGCCVNFQQFCRWTNSDQFLKTEPALTFLDQAGTRNIFRNGLLPAPGHLAASFAQLSYLSLSDKLAVSRGVRQLMFSAPPASDLFRDFLQSAKQPEHVVERFWNPVIVGALSEDWEKVSYHYARMVFLRGFLIYPSAWQIQLLRIPLQQFYDQIISESLTNNGVKTCLQQAADQFILSITPEGTSKIDAVQLKNGSTLEADHYLLAVPWEAAQNLIPQEVRKGFESTDVGNLNSAPITSVHFWFDRPITPLRHAVLIDRFSQWMFNRAAILQTPNPTQYNYQIVISNSREVGLNEDQAREQPQTRHERIQDIVYKELCEIWPETQLAKLLHARVITEHKAVFSVVPHVDRLRPSQATSIRNFYLAGDWTDTGWPATMEGAVRSGFLASEQILKQDGRLDSSSEPIVAPDLQPAWLMRLLQSLGLFKL